MVAPMYVNAYIQAELVNDRGEDLKHNIHTNICPEPFSYFLQLKTKPDLQNPSEYHDP
jgi:hypothetical protein